MGLWILELGMGGWSRCDDGLRIMRDDGMMKCIDRRLVGWVW